MDANDKAKKAKAKPSKPAAPAKAPAAAGGGAKPAAKPAPAGTSTGADAPAAAKEKVAEKPPPPPIKAAPPGSTGALHKRGVGLGRGIMGMAAREGVQKARARGRGLAGAAAAAPGIIFSSLTAAKAAGTAEDPDAVNFKGQFSKDVRAMMYGYGDDPVPLQETADLVEDVMLQYLASVVSRAAQAASDSLKPKPDERDVLFVVRKDPTKFARVKELLVMQQVIKDARNSFKEDIGVGTNTAAQADEGGAD
mmetsp:Transcript_14830/g.37013  ORF Transcript_14830/g.37013 Transcript_14830/m.37013 type:complete len:251 (-) Transcript_14830:179-931(-)|eukprot:CAMPEP_0202867174 /NCGR_PEP_ID=MMETSP1391-20130828/8861_1 /ASSEMBLY_ACC=CAM_ASM_000867 /TAXON_ID=1034604 /ORGANISM="Chlamydomonas leiostraca, Strain SAG 11-49" /LENGTH=250 /DNA_ID=CAMNT_0049547189 /DNA_START=132 /DNA_END=884 /DNA_ORIENTATION=-